MSELEKRKRIKGDLAEVIGKRTSISITEVLENFYETDSPMTIDEFVDMYAAGPDTLEDIFSDLSDATGLGVSTIRAKFRLAKTFRQFGEHLVRAGAYSEGRK
jgi:hypothetical protein